MTESAPSSGRDASHRGGRTIVVDPATSHLVGSFCVDGMHLAVECVGDPCGTPVLLAHGGGQTRGAWGRAATELAGLGAWAITMDLRGHGHSDWAVDADYSHAAYARDVAGVMRLLPRPPIVVGASAGGLAALLAIGEGLATATGLVLVDVVPEPDRAGAKRIIEFMRDGLGGFRSPDEAAAAVAAYLPNRARPVDHRGLLKNLRQVAEDRWVWHWDPAIVSKDRMPSQAESRRYYRAASNLDIPSLLLRGSRSDVVIERGIAALRKVQPRMEVEEVPGAGHMIAGDNNDLFMTALVDFLKRNDLLAYPST